MSFSIHNFQSQQVRKTYRYRGRDHRQDYRKKDHQINHENQYHFQEQDGIRDQSEQ